MRVLLIALLAAISYAQTAEVDCVACVTEFASAGGCDCMNTEFCDPTPLIPTGCDSCGDAAGLYCSAGSTGYGCALCADSQMCRIDDWNSGYKSECKGPTEVMTISTDLYDNLIVVANDWADENWQTDEYGTVMDIISHTLCKMGDIFDFHLIFHNNPVGNANDRSYFNVGSPGSKECTKVLSQIHFKPLSSGYTGPLFHEIGHTWNVHVPDNLLLIHSDISNGHWGYSILDKPGYLGGWGKEDAWCKTSDGSSSYEKVFDDTSACHNSGSGFEIWFSPSGSTAATNDGSPTAYNDYELWAMGAKSMSDMPQSKIIGINLAGAWRHFREQVPDAILAATDPSNCEAWGYKPSTTRSGCKSTTEMASTEFVMYDALTEAVCTSQCLTDNAVSCTSTMCWCPMNNGSLDCGTLTASGEDTCKADQRCYWTDTSTCVNADMSYYCSKWSLSDSVKWTKTQTATEFAEVTNSQFSDALTAASNNKEKAAGYEFKFAGIVIVPSSADLTNQAKFAETYEDADYMNTYFSQRPPLFHTATDNLMTINMNVDMSDTGGGSDTPSTTSSESPTTTTPTEEPTTTTTSKTDAGCDSNANTAEYIQCLQDRVESLEQDVSTSRLQLQDVADTCDGVRSSLEATLASCTRR